MKQLNEMTVKELKEMARDMKISNWWNMKKEVLIAKINEMNELLKEDPEEAKQQAWENERAANQNANLMKFSKEWDEAHPQDKLPERPKKKQAKVRTNFDGVKTDDAAAKPKRGALLEYNGKAQNICAWGKELGISPNTLYNRIYKQGWTIEKAFTKKKEAK